MGLRLADLMVGGAQVAVPALISQYDRNEKAKILTARDAALAKVRGAETVAGQKYKTSEREKGEAFKAGESKLERESEEKRAKIRSGGAVGKWIVAGEQLVNNVTGERMPVPVGKGAKAKMAASFVKSIKADQVKAELYGSEKLSNDDIVAEANRLADMVFGDKGDKPGGSDLPEGVTEEDIALTMKTHSLTRQQVLARLQGQK